MTENQSKKESLRMPMRFVFLEGRIRAEIDINKVQSAELLPENLATFRKMGMDHLTSIVRPESNIVLTIYPKLRAYTSSPIAPEDRTDAAKNLRLDRVKLRTEMVDGHATDVYRVTVTGANGAKQEAIVWNATDFNNFPVRIQLNQPEASVTMQYRNIQLRPPAPAEFEPPPGFTAYDSIEKLMMVAASRMTGTVKPAPPAKK
jgi:hypothetical protein